MNREAVWCKVFLLKDLHIERVKKLPLYCGDLSSMQVYFTLSHYRGTILSQLKLFHNHASCFCF